MFSEPDLTRGVAEGFFFGFSADSPPPLLVISISFASSFASSSSCEPLPL